MRGDRTFRIGVWVAFALSAACGGNPGNFDGGGTADAGGDAGGGTTRRLAIIGPPLMQVQTGATVELPVALIQENVGGVVGEIVTFEVLGVSGGSTLGGATTATATTDSQGLTSVSLTAGTDETIFQVSVTAPGANPVAFQIQIQRLKEVIQIARTPAVRVATSGTTATVDTTAFAKVLIRVRVTDQFGNAREGLPVYFTFQTTVKSAVLENNTPPPMTGAGGEAQLTIDTGTDLDDRFEITARTDGSSTATWSFALSEGSIQLCSSNAECPLGQTCGVNGVCEGLPGCDPANGIDCPTGYRCALNECEAVFGVGCSVAADCGNGYSCDGGNCVADNPTCSVPADCPSGFTCNAGTCDPTGNIPDISGPWYTAHHFDIQNAIPLAGNLSGPIRTIDRLLTGSLGLPGFIEDIIAGIVQQFIPDWFVDLIHVVDVVLTMLSDLRARGLMGVVQATGSPAWAATEVWTSFVFYDLDLCSSIPADPTPDCARVDIFVQDATSQLDLGLKVHPFNGTVGETVIVVNTREVEMRIGKLVGWLVDRLVQLWTPYNTLNDAIVGVVDCAAISNFVGFNVTGLCTAFVQSIANQVTDALFGLAFDVGILEFDGSATIRTISGNIAQELGDEDYESTRDGMWDGKFTLFDDMPGDWRASRRAIP